MNDSFYSVWTRAALIVGGSIGEETSLRFFDQLVLNSSGKSNRSSGYLNWGRRGSVTGSRVNG